MLTANALYKQKHSMSVSVKDDFDMALLRLILEHEGSRRGKRQSYVFYELVMEGADLESYPPELREYLARLGEGTGSRDGGLPCGLAGGGLGGAATGGGDGDA